MGLITAHKDIDTVKQWIVDCRGNPHDLHCGLCVTLWQVLDVPSCLGELDSLDVAEVRERSKRSLPMLSTEE